MFGLATAYTTVQLQPASSERAISPPSVAQIRFGSKAGDANAVTGARGAWVTAGRAASQPLPAWVSVPPRPPPPPAALAARPAAGAAPAPIAGTTAARAI